MSISPISLSQLSEASAGSAVATKVLKLANDTQAQMALQLIAAVPQAQQLQAPSPEGLGQLIDVYA